MHLGPFGCIATELLTENPNRPETGFQGGKSIAVSTGKTKHFLGVFGFFQRKKLSQIGGKILFVTIV